MKPVAYALLLGVLLVCAPAAPQTGTPPAAPGDWDAAAQETVELLRAGLKKPIHGALQLRLSQWPVLWDYYTIEVHREVFQFELIQPGHIRDIYRPPRDFGERVDYML